MKQKRSVKSRVDFLKRRLENENGTSLVEVVVSAVIIVAVLGLFYAGYSFANRYFANSQERLRDTEALLEKYYTETSYETVEGELQISIIAGSGNGEVIDARYEIGQDEDNTVYKTYRVEHNGKYLYYWEEETAAAP